MSYWQGKGRAPGYSQSVERANEGVHTATAALLTALQESYPVGHLVRVVHYRGQFEASVLGHDTNGARVIVRNTATGKSSKWWAAQVELKLEGGAA